MKLPLPLSADYFGRRPVTQTDQLHYGAIANRVRNELINYCQDEKQWLCVSDKKGIKSYRNRFTNSSNSSSSASSSSKYSHRSKRHQKKTNNKNVVQVLCKTEIRASLDEIMQVFSTKKNAKHSPFTTKLLDCQTVSELCSTETNLEGTYLGLKWFCLRSTIPMIPHRDFLVLEMRQKLVDPLTCEESFLSMLYSVSLKEVHSLETSHGLKRARIVFGCFYKPDPINPNLVQAYHVVNLNFGYSYVPLKLARKITASEMGFGMRQVGKEIEKKRLTKCRFVTKAQWVPDICRPNCTVCNRSFGAFRGRHHCRACGDVICRNCSVMKTFDHINIILKQVRICLNCKLNLNHIDPKDPDDENEEGMYTLSSMGSISSINSISSISSQLSLRSHTDENNPSGYQRVVYSWDQESADDNRSIRSTNSERATTAGRPASSRSTEIYHNFKNNQSSQFSESDRRASLANNIRHTQEEPAVLLYSSTAKQQQGMVDLSYLSSINLMKDQDDFLSQNRMSQDRLDRMERRSLSADDYNNYLSSTNNPHQISRNINTISESDNEFED